MTELLERRSCSPARVGPRGEGGRLVFVGGEAGVGKTTLVRALSRAGTAASCGARARTSRRRRRSGPFLDVGIELDGDPRSRRRSVLLERGGPLLVLEDVHWADQATLDVLRVLGRRIDATGRARRSPPTATTRSSGDHPLRIVLGELASARAASSRLGGAAALARRRARAGRAARAPTRRRSTGSRTGTRSTSPRSSQPDRRTLPATVRDAVLARVAMLEPAARRLLEVVAVVPARAELWLLEAVAPDELEQLDACLASGVAARGRRRSRVPARARAARGRERGSAEPRAGAPRGDRARLEGTRRRLAARPPRRGGRGLGGRAASTRRRPRGGRRGVELHREAAAQYARALRHAGALAPAERAALLAAYAQEAQVTGVSSDGRSRRSSRRSSSTESSVTRCERASLLARLTMPYIALGAQRRRRGRRACARSSCSSGCRPGRSSRAPTAAGLAAHAQPRQRRRSRLGRSGRWRRRALGDDDGLVVALNMIGTSHADGGRDRARRRVPAAQPRAGARAGQRGADQLGARHARLGARRDVRARALAERYLEEQIAFGEPHELTCELRAGLARAASIVYRGRWDEVAPLARVARPLARRSSQITGSR